MTRPRTARQLIATATKGEQRPCGFLAEHHDIHQDERNAYRAEHPYQEGMDFEAYLSSLPAGTCPECNAWSDTMRKAWAKGQRDARRHMQTYSRWELPAASKNAHQAWADVDAIEPAVSYLGGYSSVLDDACRRERLTA